MSEKISLLSSYLILSVWVWGLCCTLFWRHYSSASSLPVLLLKSKAKLLDFLYIISFFLPGNLMCLFSSNVLCVLWIWKFMSWEVFLNYFLTSSLFTPFGLLLLFTSWTFLWSLIFVYFLLFFYLFSCFFGRFQFYPSLSFWKIFCLLSFWISRSSFFFHPLPFIDIIDT